MRSSKSRSRSKQNRPRSLGNIINRVFDSSGPEGKVRGTPQQIIEKYQVLARDAQLSNDRVAAENFLQHAEHYTRMLAEAQREMAAEQEARQQQYNQNNNGSGQQGGNRDRDFREGRDNRENRWRDDRGQDAGGGEQPDLPTGIDTLDDGDSTLVETPEARAPEQPAEGGRREERGRRDDRNGPRRDRRDRGPRNEAQRDAGPAEEVTSDKAPSEKVPSEKTSGESAPQVAPTPQESASQDSEAKPRRSRGPRKPKVGTDGAGEDGGAPKAAE